VKAKAQSKALQLAGHGVPTVLVIASDHAFAGLLMDDLAAEYLTTSAPQLNVPIGDRTSSYITHDFKNSVFQRNTGLVWASGAPIVKPALRSISAILLIAVDHREMRIVGLLQLSAFAHGPGAHHAGRRLHEPAGGGMRTSSTEPSASNTATHKFDTP
jgi:hypothetical protein